tara:strand:- start:3385 stop:3999 length:615 start_codon:yes stop_codon:yes gene_type:complete
MRILVVLALSGLLAPAISSQEAESPWKPLLDVATAKVPKPTPLRAFSAICEEDDGTGFNWIDEDWKRVSFETKRYVIRKLDIPTIQMAGMEAYDATDEALGCALAKVRAPSETGALQTLTGCYSIGEFGKEQSTMVCSETYGFLSDQWQLFDVECGDAFSDPDITFLPNGRFISSIIHGQVENSPKDDFKPSLKISHGSCAVIG